MTETNAYDAENHNRDMVLFFVRDNAGCKPCDIRKNLKLSYSTITYHVSRLIGSGSIREMMSRTGIKRLYPNDGNDYNPNLNIKDLEILRFISDRGIINSLEIHAILGYSQPFISNHLRILEKWNYIELVENRDFQSKHYQIVPKDNPDENNEYE